MDRATVYFGQTPLETDILRAGQYAMTGLAKLSEATLGTSTVVAGFPIAPTVPASLAVSLGAGQVYEQENLEGSQWSSLPADGHVIVKQGLLLDPVPLTFTPPPTPGYSQCFLIEVQYQDSDTLPVQLPYYNAANPLVTLNGPAGTGTAQNTDRRGAVAYQVKNGVASSGTPVPPTPDAGWAGLYVITLAQGATSVTAGNIALYANAPFIPVTLPAVPAGVQSGQWRYGVDSGTASNLVVGLTPTPAALTVGMEIIVKPLFAPTGASVANVAGFGNLPVVKRGGVATQSNDWAAGDMVALRYTGASWMLGGLVQSDVGPLYTGPDTGAVNALSIATPSPTVTALRPWMVLITTPAALNTGPTVLNLAGLGAKPIIYPSGSPLLGGEMQPRPQVFIFDGTSWEWQGQQSPVLQQATTFYVNASNASATVGGTTYGPGSDSNNGQSAASPFASWQKAAAVVSTLNANGQAVTIQFAPGTYTNLVFNSPINGNLTLNAPSGVTFNGTVNAAILANFGAQVTVNGGTITAGSNCDGLYSLNGALINFQNVTFGVCARYHQHADGGKIGCIGNYTIAGNALSHAYVQSSGGYIILSPSYANTVTLTGSLSISQFVVATDLGFVRANSLFTTYSGSSTGTRYYASMNGVIETYGSGANFFPGSSAGATASGGEYS